MTTPVSPLEVDTIPVLFALLSRLQPPSSSGSAGSPPAATPGPAAPVSDNGPITIKQIPIETDKIKHKLLESQAKVKALPDMHRTMAEQEEEIKEWEEKIAKQRDMLRNLKDIGSAAKMDKEKRQRVDAMEE